MEKKLEILCKTINELGEIKGRKKLQKMFHIAQSLNYPIDYEFNWGNWGAFSIELQNDLELLNNQDILKETIIRDGDFVEYDYSPTDICKAYLKKEQPELPNTFFELLRFLNEKDTPTLELWSSIFYLLAQGEEGKKLVMFLNHLKPQFSEEIIQNAIKKIDKLNENYICR